MPAPGGGPIGGGAPPGGITGRRHCAVLEVVHGARRRHRWACSAAVLWRYDHVHGCALLGASAAFARKTATGRASATVQCATVGSRNSAAAALRTGAGATVLHAADVLGASARFVGFLDVAIDE